MYLCSDDFDELVHSWAIFHTPQGILGLLSLLRPPESLRGRLVTGVPAERLAVRDLGSR